MTTDDTPEKTAEHFLSSKQIRYEECDSPIEDIFLWEFRKLANNNIALRPQYDVDVGFTVYHLDFILTSEIDNISIGIECDGREFHSEARDAKRDLAIIDTGVVDKIYRLRGVDLFYSIHDTLQLLSKVEPKIFSDRGLKIMDSLCHGDYTRDDYKGEWHGQFPFAAIRYFEMSLTDDDLENLGHAERPPDKSPIVICWSANK